MSFIHLNCVKLTLHAEYNKPMYVEWDQSFDAHTRIIPLPASFSLSCDIQIVVGFFSPTEEVVIKTFRKRSGTVFWNRVRVNRIFKYLNLGHIWAEWNETIICLEPIYFQIPLSGRTTLLKWSQLRGGKYDCLQNCAIIKLLIP